MLDDSFTELPDKVATVLISTPSRIILVIMVNLLVRSAGSLILVQS